MRPDNYLHIRDTQTTSISNIDIIALKGTLTDKKRSWKVVPNEISSEHNIIELDLRT
jgi:hypothetical protein